MIKDFVKKHVAVSSLESVEHAIRKDPRIITCTWFIGKRCNYDCSYCASFYHDNYSPHAAKQDACDFIDELDNYALENNKQVKINITGGEPFVNPNFVDILEHASTKSRLSQLVVTTNGSMPLSVYTKSAEYLSNITISLHLEQPIETTERTIKTILSLNKIGHLFLNVNIMLFPGRLNQVKSIIKKFEKHNVKFVTRKIEPPFEDKSQVIQKGDLQAIKREQENFVLDKIRGKNQNKNDIETRLKQYYSEDELAFVGSREVNWNNIRLHTETDTLELNTDQLKANGLNTWQGWQCYIGIDSLYIQHNGEIFRGNCMLGEKLGNIGGTINWPVQPFTCTASTCGCNADMMVRKTKLPQYQSIIN
jgi:MoaA/NifB/PqqE/SkfB family radical SAM enzyme